MTEVTTEAPEGTETPATGAEPEVEKQAFLERLGKESSKRKEAEKKASDLEKRLAQLEADMEARATEGLPELERERKQREALEKRLADAEKAREESERQIALGRAERFVIAAAKDFVDADDAVRNVDLAEIESEEDAARAVKRVAKAKPHLLKGDDKPLPGRVLENGRQTPGRDPVGSQLEEEARGLAEQLKAHLKS